MKTKYYPEAILAVVVFTMLALTNAFADKYKAKDLSMYLNEPVAWTNNAVPDGTEFGVWSSIVTDAMTNTLGSNMTWGGIKILDPGGPISIAADGNALTLNGVSGTGIDMSSATQDLDVECDLSLGAGQSWTVATNRRLTLGGVVGGIGPLTKNGFGTLTLGGNNSFGGDVTINQGQLWIKHSNALGTGPKTVTCNNGTAGHCQLHLDGTGGNLTLSSGINYLVSNWGDPGTVYNEGGDNVINGNFTVTLGGGGLIFLVNAGSLTINGTITPDSSGRGVVFDGPGNSTVNGVIADGANYNFLFIQQGVGTTTLTAANTYKGTTDIRAGTLLVNGSLALASVVTVKTNTWLGGNGTIGGPVTVQAGAALSPGIGIPWPPHTLTVNNTLTLAAGSTTMMQLNKSTSTNDQVCGMTTLTYGGTLVVTNLGGTLAAGDSFKLFDASNYVGSFAAVIPGAPGIGMEWDTNNLTVNGALCVVAAQSNLSYTITVSNCCSLIANQFDKPGGNTLNNIMPKLPVNCRFMKFDNAGQQWITTTYSTFTGWANGAITLNPGEGAFLCPCCPTNFNLTFSGNLHVPVLPVTIPAGSMFLLSRQINGIGTYDNIVGTAPPINARLLKWDCSVGFTVYTKSAAGWTPSEPTAAVGEAMWISSSSGGLPPLIPEFDCPTNWAGGFKFNDLNYDGIWETNEPVVTNGVTIYAYDEATNLVASTVTGPDGQYFFDLPCGTYTIREGSVSNWVQTCPTNGYYVVSAGSGPYTNLNFGNFISNNCQLYIRSEDIPKIFLGGCDPVEVPDIRANVLAKTDYNGNRSLLSCDQSPPPGLPALDLGFHSILATVIDGLGCQDQCTVSVEVTNTGCAHVYFGEDENHTDDPDKNRTPLIDDPERISHPISDKAHAAFLARLTSDPNCRVIEDFEKYASESSPAVLTWGSHAATLAGSWKIKTLFDPSTFNGVFPISGTNTLLLPMTNTDQGFFSLDFGSEQLCAFGFYATDIELAQLQVTLENAATGYHQDVTIPAKDFILQGYGSGSVIFFGVVDQDHPFTKVKFTRVGNNYDGFGFDDLIVASADCIRCGPVIEGPTNIVVCIETNGCGRMPDITPLVQATADDWPVSFSQSIPAGTLICENTTVEVMATDGCNRTTSCTVPVVLEECCVPPPAGMVGWWPGDGNTLDYSVFMDHGSPVKAVSGGTVPWAGQYAPGKVQQAFNFSGQNDGYISVPDQPQLNFGTGSFSIDAWIKIPNLPPTPDGIQCIVDKRDLTSKTGYFLYLQGGAPAFDIQASGYGLLTSTATPVNDDQWHHVAVTVSRPGNPEDSGICFYVDGVQIYCSQGAAPAGSVDNTADLHIGRRIPDLPSEPVSFQGNIDEVEIFNRALSPAEIISIVAAGEHGKCKPICGRKFNDLNGNGAWDVGEPALSGWTIHLSNGQTAYTDAQGYYQFQDLPLGIYSVTEELQSCWKQTTPVGGAYSVTLNGTQSPTDLDFGNQSCVQIHCPDNLVAYSPYPAHPPVHVPFTVTASSVCGNDVTVVCNPLSDSLFSVGTTPVHCVATDTNGCSASCDFTVTVVGEFPSPLLLPPAPVPGGFMLNWPPDQGWILQQTTNLNGPWNDVTTMSNGYQVVPALPEQFFRLRSGP